MKKVFKGVSSYLRKTDLVLVLLCLVLAGFGMMVIYSTTHNSSNRHVIVQAMGLCIGLFCMIIVSLIDSDILLRLWKLYAPFCVLLMVLTYFIGYTPPGTDNKAWLQLPGGLLLQPSELLKLAFIFTLALHIRKLGEDVKTFKGVCGLVLHGAVPIVLVLIQRDWGSMLVFVFIFVFVCFAGGVRLRYFAAAFGILAVAAPLVWTYVLKDYQKKRILAVYFPELDSGYDYIYQQAMGKLSIGSGGLFGKGWLSGPRTQASIVPEQRNDFIIAALGEEFGLFGCFIVLLLLTLIMVRICRCAKKASDIAGSCICMGVFAIIFSQSVINIGMALGLLPVIGIGLPFFSAGGTSIVMSCLSIGMVLSVYNGRESSSLFDRPRR